MLTRELLRFTCRRGMIYPRLVDPADGALQQLCGELIAIYQAGLGHNQEELTEWLKPVSAAFPAPILARGLNKLLMDRCRFPPLDDNIAIRRREVFLAATRRLRETTSTDLQAFRQEVADDFQADAEAMSEQLFADLPPKRILAAFRPLSPEALLHRYNLAQAQALLWWAERLTADIWEENVVKRRRLWQNLRFCRLLATIHPLPDQGFRLELDGPLSILLQTRRYGLQLAMFLPVICAMSRWRIEARIHPPERGSGQLILDQESGLRSHRQLDGYLPEEFQLFAEQFAREGGAWRMEEEIPLLDLGGQEVVIPDFSFRRPRDEAVIHLELFHRWHATALQRRLQQEARLTSARLLLGVDRALSREAAVQPLLAASPHFQRHGLVFHEFPPVKRVLKALEAYQDGGATREIEETN